jgi:hypothetical protein
MESWSYDVVPKENPHVHVSDTHTHKEESESSSSSSVTMEITCGINGSRRPDNRAIRRGITFKSPKKKKKRIDCVSVPRDNTHGEAHYSMSMSRERERES